MKKNHWLNLKKMSIPNLSLTKRQIVFFLMVAMLTLQTNIYAQSNDVSLDLNNVTLKKAIREIEKATDYNFLYRSSAIDLNQKTSLNVDKLSIKEVVTKLFSNTGIDFKINNKQIVLKPVKKSEAKEVEKKYVEVSGKVTDKEGYSLPGATIIEEGTLNGTTSNTNGEFKLRVLSNSSLKISFIGFNTVFVPVDNRNVIDVILEESATSLDEVVVTGYQTISRERATGSFGTIQQKYIENRIGGGDIMSKIEGLTPGVMLYNTVDEDGNVQQNTLIRGVSTLEGNAAPLIVVDGFAIEGGINTINPNDIEQYTILKDAAAASIWGARASNGVIVITTKKGRKGKTQVTYRSSFEFSPKIDMSYLKKANAETTMAFEDMTTTPFELMKFIYQPWEETFFKNSLGETGWKYLSGGHPMSPYRYANVLFNNNDITEAEYNALVDKYRSTDNTQQIKDLFLRKPFTQTQYLSVQGGGEGHSFYLSANYSNSKGNYVGSDTKNYNINLQDIIRINDHFEVTLGANFSQNNNILSNVDRNILYTNPYVNFVENGQVQNFYNHFSPWEIDFVNNLRGTKNMDYSPVTDMEEYERKNSSFNTRIFAALKVDLLKDLKFDLRYQFERGSGENTNFSSQNSYITRKITNDYIELTDKGLKYHLPNTGGIFEETRSVNKSQSVKAQFDYTKSFNHHHQIVALVGMEVRQTVNEGTFNKKFGYDPNSLIHIPVDESLNQGYSFVMGDNYDYYLTGGGYIDPYFTFDLRNQTLYRGTENENRYLSYYSNFAYLYKDKYSLTASLRIDESNLFGADVNNRKEPFWSIGAKWHINKEDFFKSNMINKLSLRTSYGLNGNVAQKSGPFLIVQTSINRYNGFLQNAIQEAPNDLLKWEESKTLNFGMDISMFNSRLSGTFDVYFKKTNDILGTKEIDPTLGFRSVTSNTSSIENKGVEIRLTFQNIVKNDFSWSTMLNMSFNSNKVTDVYNPDNDVFYLTTGAQNQVGYPVSSLFRYDYLGLNENGEPLVRGDDGEPVVGDNFINIINDPKSLVNCGSTVPTFSIGLSNFIKYKNFELSFMFIMNGGNVMQKDLPNYDQDVTYGYVREGAMDVWKEAGDENVTNVPKYTDSQSFFHYNHYYSRANINVVKADYIKLRELRLTYDLPENVLNKSPFDFVQIVLQARNIWYWAANDAGIDPESHNYIGGYRNIPVSPSYSIGLNLKF